MNLPELIALDTDSVGYSTMSDNDVSIDINEKRHVSATEIKRAEVSVVRRYLLNLGKWYPIKKAAQDTSNPAFPAAWAAVELSDTADSPVDLKGVTGEGMLSMLRLIMKRWTTQ